MLDRILTFVAGGIAGMGAGVAVGLYIFPFLFPPPPAMETVADRDQKMVVATGNFIHANPRDPVHYGKGKVTVFRDAVFLENDFEVGPGPAFHVYLVPKSGIRKSGDVDGTMFVDLGRLRAFKGSQQYRIPEGVTLSDFPSVVIWCAEFGVLISPADLVFNT